MQNRNRRLLGILISSLALVFISFFMVVTFLLFIQWDIGFILAWFMFWMLFMYKAVYFFSMMLIKLIKNKPTLEQRVTALEESVFDDSNND
jgi:ABC-type multidrug transport system permease subunit